MSAMLETYDMTMVDYPTDHDIQMHPSSDQWFPDESKMEEDGPVFKSENFSDAKSGEDILPMAAEIYGEEVAEIAIEVDMELPHDHGNPEYEMEDDDLYSGSRTETLDVEVQDVDLTHSPSMPILETTQGDTHNLESIGHDGQHGQLSVVESSRVPSPEPVLHSLENPSEESNPAQVEEATSVVEENIIVIHDHDVQPGVGEAEATSADFPEGILEHSVDEVEARVEHEEVENSAVSEAQHLGSTVESASVADAADDVASIHHVEESGEDHGVQEPLEINEDTLNAHAETHGEHDLIDGSLNANSPSANTSGDPHEISEGVYIDPPPPVLLSLTPEDQFDYCLFNDSESTQVPSVSGGDIMPSDRVFLRHLPTLYYEPVSSVFDALREEGFIQTHFSTAESELVLEAVDLELSLSEDNIYSREVTLHDLNVLHDVSGIHGLLRMRLKSSLPRFITRYQYLQEHVSRLTLDEQVAEAIPTVSSEEKKANEADIDQSHEEETHPLEHETVVQDVDASASHDNHEIEEETPNEEERTSTQAVEEQARREEDREEYASETYTEEKDGQPSVAPQSDSVGDVVEATDELTGQHANQETAKDQEFNNIDHEPADDFSTAEDGSAVLDEDGNTIPLEVLEEEYPEDGEVYNEVEDEVDPVSNDFPHIQGNDEGADNNYEVADDDGSHGGDGKNDTELLETDYLENADEQSNRTGGQPSLHEGEPDATVVSTTVEHEHDNLGQETLQDNEHVDGASEQQFSYGVHISEVDPLTFEEGDWEDEGDGEFEPASTWDEDQDNELAASNHSSVTLSSKTSKRSFDEFEHAGDDYEEVDGHWSPPSSPESKRSRIQ
ncbi:hypothetical protein D9613_002881 [Agrocybe pediades]|uniref:Uncharacterized protein n=1 Tax=Agrocybe pediades TaxID=84607 RepID=A0A8H4QNS4_9AGAR|nr:hypothetical protein D9613_002881 [Agrocybe pediades]